ncbi:hypothetical protein PIB30_097234 [Stylosanthes scabra]|uniref:F-box domain-containing protein n=1 Tax=Stylosanthes scabra TaxID=79078 RepID=A0ABU6RWR8_9FABA|nr:hypothetical protein [Stylosanthes scabra]
MVMAQPHDYDQWNRKPFLSSVVTPSQPLRDLTDEVIREILLRLPTRCLVLSLGLVKETSNEFSLPCEDPEDSGFTELCVLKNCLAVCSCHEKTHWTLWLMKEYGEPQSWTKLVMIFFHRLVSSPLGPL